jgi:hypothetical protein
LRVADCGIKCKKFPIPNPKFTIFDYVQEIPQSEICNRQSNGLGTACHYGPAGRGQAAQRSFQSYLEKA